MTRSLVEGLQKIGANFNYNPVNKRDIRGKCDRSCRVERLKKMIGLKKKGDKRFVVAGPNVCDMSLWADRIVTDPAIDICVPSMGKGPADFLQRELKDRGLTCWPAGVDTDFWQPSLRNKETGDVLLYWKPNPMRAFVRKLERIVREQADDNPVLIKCGDYTSRNINGST